MEKTGKIQNWKTLFPQNALELGKDYWKRGRVVDLKEEKDGYSAAVIGDRRYEVKIRENADGQLRMRCVCPQANGGGHCRHMAAVFYAIEAQQGQKDAPAQENAAAQKPAELPPADSTPEGSDRSDPAPAAGERDKENKAVKENGGSRKESARKPSGNGDKAQEEAPAKKAKKASKENEETQLVVLNPGVFSSDAGKDGQGMKHAQDSYSYFDIEALRQSLELTPAAEKKGLNHCRHREVVLDDIHFGYSTLHEGMLGEVEGRGVWKNKIFSLHMVFNNERVLNMECHCPDCSRRYYGWYDRRKDCSFTAGLFCLVEEYLKTYHPGDATDRVGRGVLLSFQTNRTNRIRADVVSGEESLTLRPRLTRKDGRLSLSFKVGSSKLFVVKNLQEFCQNVKESATATYGSGTEINHRLGNFTQEGKKWIRFATQVVQEEAEFERRLLESHSWSRRAAGKSGSLELYGWRLDRFYELLKEGGVEFEEKEEDGKRKGVMTCGEKNPDAFLCICPEEEKNIFQGIRVRWEGPKFLEGAQTSYFVEEKTLKLCRVAPQFMESVSPLLEMGSGSFSFVIGRNSMAEFYYSVLPQLREAVEVREEDPGRIERYLPAEARFVFYLDALQGTITCTAYARYGDRQISLTNPFSEKTGEEPEIRRQHAKEEEVVMRLMQWFPYYDEEHGELNCGPDEELAHQFLENGLDVLLTMGEVQCTRRFQNLNRARKVRISVGVSVSKGLLDLDISAEDISRKELLEVLDSYRRKKKFHRLKNGDFLNLNDEGLAMLEEMMESLHLSPKEFVKGKMHLPLYRTLYLEKMLEEQETVYSTRDSRFREMVKEFKTVSDADFEEPPTLSKVMRKYQVLGYKWLRTLETMHFGGILADDMGLGKTLQTIAVLLSAKLEGRSGRTLIVTPASLVFNWGEEIRRFAPQLEFCLVTGTQEERRKKIESWQDFDVLVTSYDLLKRDIPCYEGKRFDYQVIDEAQYIKNQTTAAAKAVKVIESTTRFALTGTPIENRLSELWSIFDYLMPGYLYGYDVFKNELETPIAKNKEEAAAKRLQKMVSPFILRRLKQDVLKDLPDKLEEVRYVRLEGKQEKLYRAQAQLIRGKIASQDAEEFRKNRMQVLAELMKLRQICCDPSLCYENYDGESAKRDSCLELIESAIEGGHRMLVFSQFTSMLDLLMPELEKRGIPYFTITGSTGKETRLKLVKEFNEGDTKVFLISLKAGGVGLNLTGADVVIHYDPWWNVAVQNQATDRAHRIGQTRKVTVYQLIAKHTVEEKIRQLQETKQDLSDQILKGEGGQLAGMTKEDFLELLEG